MFNRKTQSDRITDAIDYITRLDIHLGNEIGNSLDDNTATTLGKEISLGFFAKSMEKDEEKRTALRALLLCHRYFFSGLDRPTWKASSLGHWKGRSRMAIDKAILLFTADCDTAATLADVAEAAGKAPTGAHPRVNYTISRAENEPFELGNGTCFIAIMAWLLKSGIVSYQWYLQNFAVKDVGDLVKRLGGPEQVIWTGERLFTKDDTLTNVPRGYIVHFVNEKLPTFGHWMVSLGDGTAVGANNSTYLGGANVLYDNKVNLKNEFLHGFNTGNGKFFPKGVASMYNPLLIPNRKMVSAP
jgi:hypothetical protein